MSQTNVYDLDSLRAKLTHSASYGYNLIAESGEIVSWYESRAEAITRLEWEYMATGRVFRVEASDWDC